MAFKIGFMANRMEKKEQGEIAPIQKGVVVPKKSVVQVRFPGKAPAKEDEEYASGKDDFCFPLSDLNRLKVSSAIAERGQNYYQDNKVRYLRIDSTQGRAIVEGTETYAVEF